MHITLTADFSSYIAETVDRHFYVFFVFISLTLLIGRQESHPVSNTGSVIFQSLETFAQLPALSILTVIFQVDPG